MAKYFRSKKKKIIKRTDRNRSGIGRKGRGEKHGKGGKDLNRKRLDSIEKWSPLKSVARYRKIYSLVGRRKKISPFVLRALKRFERDGRGSKYSRKNKGLVEAANLPQNPVSQGSINSPFLQSIESCLKFDRNVEWIYVYLRRSKHSDVGIKRCRDVHVRRTSRTFDSRLTRDSVQRVSVSNEDYNIFCANHGNYFQEIGGNICRRDDFLFDSIS